MHMCVRGIDLASFNDFSIEFATGWLVVYRNSPTICGRPCSRQAYPA